jgi:hypothetical protein
MLGYVDRVDIENRLIHGWASAEDGRVNAETRVVAYLDGRPVGEVTPTRHRVDLDHITDQAAGFSLPLDTALSALDFAAGRVAVRAVHGEDEAELAIIASLQATLRVAAIEALRQKLPGHVAVAPGLHPVRLDAHTTASVSQGLMSPLQVPVGQLSLDGTARVGRQGHLFLTRGSNALSDLYEDSADYGTVAEPQGKLRDWLQVVEQRRLGCEQRGVRFLQTFVPEKLTALRALAPIPISGPTPLMQRVDEALAGAKDYLSGTAVLEAWQDPSVSPYFEPDTHFSVAGAQHFFRALVESLAPTLVPEVTAVPLRASHLRQGDLSSRFGLPIHATWVEPDEATAEKLGRDLVTLQRQPSASGGVGSRYAFRTPRPRPT